jgi:hypothetical protein
MGGRKEEVEWYKVIKQEDFREKDSLVSVPATLQWGK